jgi:hypothetical protein
MLVVVRPLSSIEVFSHAPMLTVAVLLVLVLVLVAPVAVLVRGGEKRKTRKEPVIE